MRALRLSTLVERFRSSLFYVPMAFTAIGALLAQGALALDENATDLPTRLTATVDSARAVLTVVAAATITFAGIAFSVSLLLISMASSQYSPRVVHGLFRDPFNKRIIGVVVGTFTYCLVVLRAVRGPLEEGADAFVPSTSVIVAALLGIVSIMSIVAFINHAAHSMDVSKILHRVTSETIDQIHRVWHLQDTDAIAPDVEIAEPEGDGCVMAFDRSGWIQQIDDKALLAALPPHGAMQVETVVGRYAIQGTPFVTVWPKPSEPEKMAETVLEAVVVGQTRTMQQDVTYGVRQLADVALKALSPGINDPTTAQDALFHLGSALRELLVRRPPERLRTGPEGRCLVLPQNATHAELAGLAFDEIRVAAGTQPTVQIYLLEILHLLSVSIDHPGSEDAIAALRAQADLVVAVNALAELAGDDHARVVAAHAKRFGTVAGARTSHA